MASTCGSLKHQLLNLMKKIKKINNLNIPRRKFLFVHCFDKLNFKTNVI